MLVKLARRPELGLRERLALVDDLGALVLGGAIPAGDALEAIADAAAAPDADPRVLIALVKVVEDMAGHDFVDDAVKGKLALWVRKTFGARARALGWRPKVGEDEGTRLLRAPLLALVADRGEDPALAAEAVAMARKWINERKTIDPDVRDLVVEVAARHGDAALYDKLADAARKTKDPGERVMLHGIMAHFPDAAQVRAVLDAALGGEGRETVGVFREAEENERAREAVYEYLKKNFAQVVARFPDDVQSRIFSVARHFCDPARREDFARFARPVATGVAGGPRVVDQVLEEIDLCVAARKIEAPSAAAYLQRVTE
jgi:alanyl aminopeptidase